MAVYYLLLVSQLNDEYRRVLHREATVYLPSRTVTQFGMKLNDGHQECEIRGDRVFNIAMIGIHYRE